MGQPASVGLDVVLPGGMSSIGALFGSGYSPGLISVYPAFTRIDITPLVAAPAEPRFVLDVHLGRLASHLRRIL